MEEKIRQGNLFDFYGLLLKESQRDIVEAYVCEDLSLSEIAAQNGLSRQGVHDIIKRATLRMEEFDSVLNLIDRFDTMRDSLESINDYTKNIRSALESNDTEGVAKYLKDIDKTTENLLEEL